MEKMMFEKIDHKNKASLAVLMAILAAALYGISSYYQYRPTYWYIDIPFLA